MSLLSPKKYLIVSKKLVSMTAKFRETQDWHKTETCINMHKTANKNRIIDQKVDF